MKISKNSLIFSSIIFFTILFSTFYYYLRPNDSIKEINGLSEAAKNILVLIKENDYKINKVEKKELLPKIAYFKSNKNIINIEDVKEQENGTNILYFTINEKTRTLYIYSNDYNERFCNDLITWGNQNSLRNSDIGKLFQVNNYNEMIKFKNSVSNNLKLNNFKILSKNLKCKKNNDLVYIETY